MFGIYSFFYSLITSVLFLPQYFRRPAEFRGRWLKEKFGFLPETGSGIWVHAVSVGEVNAALPLLAGLKERFPHLPLILSTITDTGQKTAMDKSPEGTNVVYLPFDVKSVLERAVSRVNPEIFIIIETELWPNLLRVMSLRDVPVIMLNGRISEASLKGYRQISFFMKKVFSCVSFFGMQSDIDADRLKKIGVDAGKVSVTGNFKFDMQIPKELPLWARNIKGPVLAAGSTHRGEEEIILSAYMENLAKFPELKLIVAPRHPERFSEAEGILKAGGIPVIKRSEFHNSDAGLSSLENWILLLDSIGELPAVYGIADIVIMGKSFTGFGGQNPLEPACWGKPVICGPHMENFPFIRDFYREGAAYQADRDSLAGRIKELLSAPDKAEEAGTKARDLFMKNAGAVDSAIDLIGKYIGNDIASG